MLAFNKQERIQIMTTTVEKATQYIVDASELINKKFEHIDVNRRIEVIYRVADLTSQIECVGRCNTRIV